MPSFSERCRAEVGDSEGESQVACVPEKVMICVEALPRHFRGVVQRQLGQHGVDYLKPERRRKGGAMIPRRGGRGRPQRASPFRKT
eukprot:1264752-Heterocapsa_arctica.AAC.1